MSVKTIFRSNLAWLFLALAVSMFILSLTFGQSSFLSLLTLTCGLVLTNAASRVVNNNGLTRAIPLDVRKSKLAVLLGFLTIALMAIGMGINNKPLLVITVILWPVIVSLEIFRRR